MIDSLLLSLAEASAACYVVGSKPWFESPWHTCHVYKSQVLGSDCYAFEGTQSFEEWLIDFFGPDIPFYQHPKLGPVHQGFWLDIQGALAAIAADRVSALPFYVTGHSKGAGEALLATAGLCLAGKPPLATYVYEPPCVGTDTLGTYLANQDIGYTVTWNSAGLDIVTEVPDWPEWQHQGVLTKLQVPDNYGIARKHKIPAVLAAIQQLGTNP